MVGKKLNYRKFSRCYFPHIRLYHKNAPQRFWSQRTSETQENLFQFNSWISLSHKRREDLLLWYETYFASQRIINKVPFYVQAQNIRAGNSVFSD